MRRVRRAALVVAVLAVASVALSACGSSTPTFRVKNECTTSIDLQLWSDDGSYLYGPTFILPLETLEIPYEEGKVDYRLWSSLHNDAGLTLVADMTDILSVASGELPAGVAPSGGAEDGVPLVVVEGNRCPNPN